MRIFALRLPKPSAGNISGAESEALSTAAGAFITASDDQVMSLLANGRIVELECEQP